MGSLEECADYQKEYEYLNKVFWQKDDQTTIFDLLGVD